MAAQPARLRRGAGSRAPLLIVVALVGVLAGQLAVLAGHPARGTAGTAVDPFAGAPAEPWTQANTASLNQQLNQRAPGPVAASPTALPEVAPLGVRRSADVLVRADTSLPAATVARIRDLAGAQAAELVDAAVIKLQGGTTVALGIDPSSFRAFTPAGTAEATPAWQVIASGDVAVAHAVGQALQVPLGGTTTAGVGVSVPVRVGAYLTTGLPGVGLLADHATASALGLVPASALVLSLPGGRDPTDVAARISRAVGGGVSAVAVHPPVAVDTANRWVPPAIGPITGVFGLRRFPLDPTKSEFHAGLDIGAPLGAPVYAASDGVVLYAGPATGFGNDVILAHSGGVVTLYGHMRYWLVKPGMKVRAGQRIALVGSEGESTGAHLHFEVHVNNQPVDPLRWLKAHGVSVS